MFQILKNFRNGMAGYDPKFLALPIIFAILVPNLLEPAWIWRLLAVFIAGLSLATLSIYGLIAPEQIFQKKYNQLVGSKKYLFWLLYTMIFVALPLAFYLFLVPAGGDLYRVVQGKDTALASQTLEFINTEHDGGVSPWFMYQRLYTVNQTEYILYFDFQAFGPGTYNVTYSPYTKIIYDISRSK